jgi:hypothetical protein
MSEDLKAEFASLKTRPGSCFVVTKDGSTIDLILLAPSEKPRLKKEVQEAKIAIGGTFEVDKGQPIFTITHRKGALNLNSTVKMTVKTLIGVSAMPEFIEAASVEDATDTPAVSGSGSAPSPSTPSPSTPPLSAPPSSTPSSSTPSSSSSSSPRVAPTSGEVNDLDTLDEVPAPGRPRSNTRPPPDPIPALRSVQEALKAVDAAASAARSALLDEGDEDLERIAREHLPGLISEGRAAVNDAIGVAIKAPSATRAAAATHAFGLAAAYAERLQASPGVKAIDAAGLSGVALGKALAAVAQTSAV